VSVCVCERDGLLTQIHTPTPIYMCVLCVVCCVLCLLNVLYVCVCVVCVCVICVSCVCCRERHPAGGCSHSVHRTLKGGSGAVCHVPCKCKCPRMVM